jgi:hypothetical protein
MESNKKAQTENESNILFSKAVKAGQRIYYVDVKMNKKDEMYLSITESKKLVSGTTELPQYNYEKHKIFLFKEDFQKFQESLNEAINYINNQQGPAEQRAKEEGEINIDLEF